MFAIFELFISTTIILAFIVSYSLRK